ncbi:MAG: hypothetical protein JXQ75_05210 [Phycisphaerae bacterium]|nr:hypothetical protein [Phycisphaerae bacterium]
MNYGTGVSPVLDRRGLVAGRHPWGLSVGIQADVGFLLALAGDTADKITGTLSE